MTNITRRMARPVVRSPFVKCEIKPGLLYTATATRVSDLARAASLLCHCKANAWSTFSTLS
jgi:hypothetical protein